MPGTTADDYRCARGTGDNRSHNQAGYCPGGIAWSLTVSSRSRVTSR